MKRLLCLILGHRWVDEEKITVQPHESVAHMGDAIFMQQRCLRCEARQQIWIRHPFHPEMPV